jgi:hypothetical protein
VGSFHEHEKDLPNVLVDLARKFLMDDRGVAWLVAGPTTALASLSLIVRSRSTSSNFRLLQTSVFILVTSEAPAMVVTTAIKKQGSVELLFPAAR